MKRLLPVFLCLVLVSLVGIARAEEELSDNSIRALYALREAAVGDPDKTGDFLDERLDDFYTLRSNLTQKIGNAPPRLSASSSDKTQTIDNVMRGYNIMKVDRYRSSIKAIQYSDDHQYAYVITATASSGTISVPLPDGGYKASDYQDGEACIDQLAIIHEKLKFLQSACNENFVIKK